jgi:predicted kinase
MKTYNQFLEESWNRKSQQASKSGKSPKDGLKSGKSELKSDVKMIGIPGSGKSTMAKRLAKATGGTRDGFDDARKRIYGDHTTQGDIFKVKDDTYNKLANARKDKPRVLDNTNVNKNFKAQTDNELKTRAKFGKTIPVSPDTSNRRAFKRNSRREKPVPKFVMRQFMKPQGDQTRKTKEGREAIQNGRELTKRYRLNRNSTRAKLGVENPKRGKA